ncbi:hypothetical protein DES45_103321 [Microvirga subterranea]|uniref:Uncharacterized protein n=1 Tax=Microvirga subterranea TaxID=186651 RepID=A0A370HQ37_9HYPH|nr:hypothetical protein DES45_103321 [Microvirga subterranea]
MVPLCSWWLTKARLYRGGLVHRGARSRGVLICGSGHGPAGAVTQPHPAGGPGTSLGTGAGRRPGRSWGGVRLRRLSDQRRLFRPKEPCARGHPALPPTTTLRAGSPLAPPQLLQARRHLAPGPLTRALCQPTRVIPGGPQDRDGDPQTDATPRIPFRFRGRPIEMGTAPRTLSKGYLRQVRPFGRRKARPSFGKPLKCLEKWLVIAHLTS